MRKLIKKIINEKKVVIFFKIVISLVLISYLIFDESIKLSLLFNSLFLHNGKLLILILIIFLTIIIGAYRWYLILKVFKFDISLYKVFKITYIGNFFNNLLLGGYGGDALRIHYICKASDKKNLHYLQQF
jgi:glycosyltransferase 2 family protein